MHAQSRVDDDPVAEINMIPLIDIALTLVIILMVTTAFIRSPGVALRLPESQTREGTPETNKDLIVVVSKDGRAFLEGVSVAPRDVGHRLRQVAGGNSEARVMIKGDRSAAYAAVMGVMDSVRQAGFRRVVLPTQPPPAAKQEKTAGE